MAEKITLSKEQLVQIIEQYPTPFHIYDGRRLSGQMPGIAEELSPGRRSSRNTLR